MLTPMLMQTVDLPHYIVYIRVQEMLWFPVYAMQQIIYSLSV